VNGSARWTVVLMMGTAFAVFTIGRNPKNIELPDSQALWSWALLTIMLAVMVDIEATEEVASALSVAILVTIMLLYGEQVFAWITGKTQANASSTTTRVGIPGRYAGKEIPI
jgi:uncharacterized membrane protein AbrB (regulator of aidB expression)